MVRLKSNKPYEPGDNFKRWIIWWRNQGPTAKLIADIGIRAGLSPMEYSLFSYRLFSNSGSSGFENYEPFKAWRRSPHPDTRLKPSTDDECIQAIHSWRARVRKETITSWGQRLIAAHV